ELMLGLQPLSLFDGLATPMYGAFTNRPDFTPYNAIQPEQSLTETNPPMPASAAQVQAAQLPFNQLDAVPQALSDQMLWQSIYGWNASPPPPGPEASPQEHARALVTLQNLHDPDALAVAPPPDDDDDGAS